jgi:K(+)-stimulated pyrophosphate-energized sodium pump
LLAVQLAVKLTHEQGAATTHVLAALFFFVSVVFVWRSFYAMRIGTEKESQNAKAAA